MNGSNVTKKSNDDNNLEIEGIKKYGLFCLLLLHKIILQQSTSNILSAFPHQHLNLTYHMEILMSILLDHT
jgi:hypothetical protein